MHELCAKGAGELAALIAKREVSSREVIDAHLARIEEVNPHLNAIVRTLTDESRAAADGADRAVASGDRLGPLHGVPCTVKENIDLAGTPTTHGIRALAEVIATVDAPVVERMKNAGAVVIGRTNLPDWALRVHTDSSLHGLTRNPWDPTRTAGGSSGGEGSALASGMSPIGLGNDIGGSLRNPATCCGIASIKPSAGRVPSYGTIPMADSRPAGQIMPVDGPMARRIADVRLGLEILNGPDPRDPYSVPAPLESPRPARPLRVAALASPPGGSTDPRIAARVEAAAGALAASGYEVVAEKPPRFEEAVQIWAAFLLNDVRLDLPVIGTLMSDEARGFLEAALETYPALDLDGYTQILMARQAIMREWALWFTAVDVLLTPAWTQLPFAHGWDAAHADNALPTLEMMRCVVHANLLGLPSACVSAGLVDGLPVGVLCTTTRFADDLALDAAEVIEATLAPTTPIDPIT
jgi:amidase